MYFRSGIGDDTVDTSIDSYDSGVSSLDTSSSDSGSLQLTPPTINWGGSSSSSGPTPPPAPPAPAASSSGTPWQAITGAIGSGLSALFAPSPTPAQTAAAVAAARNTAASRPSTSSFSVTKLLPWVALGGGVIVLAMVLRKKS